MAGDWIKLRKNIFSDPKVMRIARKSGLCEEACVGWLCKLWCWADEVTSDGNADGVTQEDVSRVTGVPMKVLAAASEVGWFLVVHEGVCFPEFDKHMSNSAKTRALTQKRVEKHRKTGATKAKRTDRYNRVTREEKRREEKRRSKKEESTKEERTKQPAAGKRPNPPSVEEVTEYCQSRGNCVDPQQFVDHYEANGWVQGRGKPIKDWRAAVRTWERNGISGTPKTKELDF